MNVLFLHCVTFYVNFLITAKELHDTFFNETLELSQEDIQKTLSANMPLEEHNGESIVGDLNPMDFIDNCCNVGKYNK